MKANVQKIFMLPFALNGNTYMGSLRTAIETDSARHAERSFVILPFSYSAYLSAALCGEQPIAHIHMETNIYGSAYSILSIARIIMRFPVLFLARAYGARIVWTLHNLYAHDYPHPAIDAFGRSCMWRLADIVIVQNEQIISELKSQHPYTRIVYIPHANYSKMYDSPVPRAQARAELHIAGDACVFICLGTIRPYKQLEIIIDAVCAATRHEDSKLLLLIAGKGEDDYIEKLSARTHGNPAVRIISGFVPDAQVPVFFGAADYAVFAYADSSLTSGALLLALSYDVPVITKAMPAAELIHEGINGYVVSDDEALMRLIAECEKKPHLTAGAAMASVASFTWERVGKETCAVYDFCIGL